MPSWELVEPENPILMLLEGNGSLLGRDRDGSFSATGSGALRYSPAPGARINYAANGSGESGVVYAFVTDASPGTTNDRELGDASHGDYSIHAVCDGTTSAYGSANFYGITSLFKPLAGQDIWLRFKWKGTGQLRYVLFRVYDAAGAVADSAWLVNADVADPPLVPPTEYEEVVIGPITVPPGVSAVQLTFAQHADVTGVDAYDIRYDEVMLTTEDPTGWAYFDGNADGVFLDPVTGQLGAWNTHPSVDRAVFWIEEGTTNLVANPSFETNTSGWGPQATPDIFERVTTASKYGGASLHIVTSNDQYTGAVASWNSTVGTYTGSFSILGDAGDKVRVLFFDGISAWGSTEFTLTGGGWEEFAITAAVTTAGGNGFYIDTGDTPQTVDWLIDGVQIENKAYATSYCDGSLGTGYAWTGVAHASTSTRAVGYVTTNGIADLSSIVGSTVVRYMADIAITARILTLGGWIGTANNLLLWTSDSASLSLDAGYDGGGSGGVAATPAPLTADVFDNIYGGWDGLDLWVGTLPGTPDAGNRLSVDTDPLFGGTGEVHIGVFFNSMHVGPWALYDRPLTDAELLDVNDTIAFDEDLWDLLIPPPDVGGPTSGGPMFSYGFSARPSAGVGVIDRRKKKRHVSLDVIMHPDDERVRRS